jgi:hypothetical protein
MNSTRIQQLKEFIDPVRNRLIAHPIYRAVQTPSALRIFMEYHVYAVWDFMSLLKALQQSLTCVDVPWVPRGTANTRYLINEIVVGEESDVDEQGRRVSHFELYLRAMREAGASVEAIGRFTAAAAGVRAVGVAGDEPAAAAGTQQVEAAVREAIAGWVPQEAVRKFLDFTFDTIFSGEVYRIAAVFTFGREDLIPDLFLPIVQELSKEKPGFETFRYYLERHIEVDGGHHSHLAMEMLEELCGDDAVKWRLAGDAARAALEARIALWDGVVAAIGAGVMV